MIKKLGKEIILLDGSMGTYLHRKGYNELPEKILLKNPTLIKEIHNEYKRLGSDIIISCTFNANLNKLKEYRLSEKADKINKLALKIAKESSKYVLGGLGPLGEYLKPLGKIDYKTAYEIYLKQVISLKGADGIIIETIEDIQVMKAAIDASRHLKVPIYAMMSFDKDKTTATGTDIETFVNIAEAMGVEALGANCSVGSKEMIAIAKEFQKYSSTPVITKPNAGLPNIKEGIFPESKEEFFNNMKKIAQYGVSIIGGCCGTTPEYIKELKKIKTKPIIKEQIRSTLCTRTKTRVIRPVTIAGDRINPSGKKNFQKELKKRNMHHLALEASQQLKEGAKILDINVSIIGTKESEIIKSAIDIIQNITQVPIIIDTTDLESLETALQIYAGKALINSINGTRDSIREIIPLAKKYGASVIILPFDEKGIPKTINQKIKIAEKIYSYAVKKGIRKQDIYFDPIIMSLIADEKAEENAIKTLKAYRKKGWNNTIAGITNISHGLQNRSFVNHNFYKRLVKENISIALMNPKDRLKIKNNTIQKKTEKQKIKTSSEHLAYSIIAGDKKHAQIYTRKLLNEKDWKEVNDILLKSMDEVGKKFKKKELYLHQVLASAKAMHESFSIIKKKIPAREKKAKGSVILATVKGDVHDLGKNIFKALLESYGIEVIDLGKSVDVKKIIIALNKYDAKAVGLSALMTTTVKEMEIIIRKLKTEGLDVPVICGGAIVTKSYVKKIEGIYAKDAIDGIKKIKKIIY